MRLDIPTLAIVTVFVTALLGALLIFAGMQNRSVRAPAIWGMAFLLSAVGMVLAAVRGRIPDWLSIEIANALVLTGIGLVWAGARVFDERPVRLPLVALAPMLWFAACLVPAIGSDINLRTIVVSALASLLTFATAREIWRGRAEPLLSRWPTVVTLMAYGVVMATRVPLTLLVPQPAGAYHYTDSTLFPLLAFGTLLFTVVLAFLLLNMSKERSELRHKIASLIDPLCGVPNRRAFLDGAEQLAARQREAHTPLAVLLFDLDHFKAINDQLGHAAGDDVLKSFAAAASRALGPDVLFGRIGGEEFAAVSPVATIGEAVAMAERVRRAFAAAAATQFDDDIVMPTVSAGVALAAEPPLSLDTLMAAADRALYRAKAKGRNRVESAASVAAVSAAPSLVPHDLDRRHWRGASVGA